MICAGVQLLNEHEEFRRQISVGFFLRICDPRAAEKDVKERTNANVPRDLVVTIDCLEYGNDGVKP